MDDMRFTELGTAILGSEEITIKEFFKEMEENLDTSDYNIDYLDNGDLIIRYDGDDYKVKLSKDEAKNPSKYSYLKKLFELGRVEIKADIDKYNEDDSNTELSIKEKKKFLSILKKKKAKKHLYNIGEYLSDLAYDIGDTFSDLSFDSDEIIVTDAAVSGSCAIVAAVIATPVILAFGASTLWLLTCLSGVGLSIVIDFIWFLCYHIPKRFKSIGDFIKDRVNDYDDEDDLFKTKIKGLRKSILKDILAKFKKKDKNIIEMTKVSSDDEVEKYVPLSDESELLNTGNIISKMLYETIQSVKQIDEIYIGDLKKRLEKLICDYQEAVAAKKSDAEIMFEIRNEWIDLDRRISEAKRYDASRYYEAENLMDELNNINNDSTDEVLKPRLDSNPKVRGKKRGKRSFKDTSNH